MKTSTTTHLNLSRASAWLDRLPIPPALIVACLIFIVAGAITAVGRLGRPPAAAAVPTPVLPIIIVATAPAVVVPTPAAAQVTAVLPNTLRRAVVAYDSPNGNALGAIEQGRAYAVLARYGADWLQADVRGSGVVWLQTADVFDLPSDLADLAPLPTPQIVTVPISPILVRVPAEQTYQVTNEPPPPPAEALQGGPVVMTDDQRAAVGRQLNVTDDQRAQAFDAHQAQQRAWCEGQNSAYCDMVRQATP
jgi:hypothetical protein